MSQGGGVPGRLWRLVSIGGGCWAERRSSAEALRILSSLLQMIMGDKQLYDKLPANRRHDRSFLRAESTGSKLFVIFRYMLDKPSS